MGRPGQSAIAIPLACPNFSRIDPDTLLSVLASGWATNGPEVRTFEEEFAAYQGVDEAVAVSSGSAALHLALLASGVGPGDEVITSATTYVATCNAIVHCGAKPILVDVEPGTLLMDAEQAGAAVTGRTRAIIAVHFAGQPVDVTAFEELRDEHGLALIHDLAHAAETHYEGASVASRGDACCYSFYATKNLAIGEGGMVTTADPALARSVRMLRAHGVTRDTWSRRQHSGASGYDVSTPGFNYKLTELQAAIGRQQLPHLEARRRLRAEICRAYDRALGDLPALRLLDRAPRSRSAHHLYVVRLTEAAGIGRETFMVRLAELGIETGIHFPPIASFTWYARRYGWRLEDWPVAWSAGETCTSLPLYPELTREKVARVVEAVRRALGA
ncbi:MAG: DegT/DnrJ/EryC1/StrS family aminotransferase [Myxococcota bacterium]